MLLSWIIDEKIKTFRSLNSTLITWKLTYVTSCVVCNDIDVRTAETLKNYANCVNVSCISRHPKTYV